jgi:hypothetical protein
MSLGAANASALEREIALQLCALNVLTPEEIKIFEGGESKR